jgi:hypothetical protein
METSGPTADWHAEYVIALQQATPYPAHNNAPTPSKNLYDHAGRHTCVAPRTRINAHSPGRNAHPHQPRPACPCSVSASAS